MKEREMDQASKDAFKKVITNLVDQKDGPLEYYKGINYVDVTPEYIRNTVERERQEIRRKRRGRLLPVVVICTVVLVTSSAMVMLMPGKEVEAVRHRLKEQISGWGDLMKDTEENPSQQDLAMGDLSKTVDKWEDVEGAKNFLPELYIPAYIPEAYDFIDLNVQKSGQTEYLAIFRFMSEEEKEINIIQRSKGQTELQVLVPNATSSFETAQGIVYVTEDEFTARLSGVLLCENAAINVSAELSLEELQKIFENLQE